MKKTALIVGISFLAGAIFFALTFGYLHKETNEGLVLSPQKVEAEVIKPQPQKAVFSFAPLVKRVRPAVVKVISESIVETRGMTFGDDFFDRFFDIPKRKEKRTGIGSGFFISSDGYILTNNHVVDKAVKVKIVDINKKEYKARIVGTDPKTDLALLKIKGKNFPYIELGDSNKVEVGEWVLAIGNPFYQDLSVTAGIISAKGRQLRLAEYEDFLQTDAAINRGNSGGPLINMDGKVIGINTVIFSPSGGNVGIGFAIPSNMAKKVVKDLKEKGRVVRGWLGVSIQEVSDYDAKDFDLPSGGVIITSVENGSPAEKGGLRRMDLIISINGKKIKSAVDLKLKIADTNPGDVINLGVYRGNKKLNIKVKVGEAPDTIKLRGSKNSISFDLGMILMDNNRSVMREYGLRTSKGIVVKRVKRGSIAEDNGIKEGDVILGVNRTSINSVEQFRKIMSKKRPGSRVFLYIDRYGTQFFLKFYLPEE